MVIIADDDENDVDDDDDDDDVYGLIALSPSLSSGTRWRVIASVIELEGIYKD